MHRPRYHQPPAHRRAADAGGEDRERRASGGGIAHDFNNLLTAILGYSELLLGRFAEHDPNRADLEEIQKAGQRAAALTQQLLAFSRKQVLMPKQVDLNETVAALQSMLVRLIRADITLSC